MGDLLALGVKPVATYQTSGTAYEKEVADLSVWNQFEAEEIMAFDPDLILVVNQEQYDEVSKIAPTILIPFTQLSMDERVTYLGEILNKQEEAKKALTDFKEKIAKAKETLNQKGITSQNFSIFEASSNGGIWVYGDKWGRGGDLIYSQLGLNAPDIIQKEIIAKDQYRELSMESVQDYAGDYIIFSGELGSLLDNPVWNSIPAVKAGNVIPINEELFYDIDLYSSGVQLDYLIKALIDK
jgi:iron complex transport system substrate-binding protein